MEDQLGSLGLVLNAVVLWTTRYIDAAVAQLRAEGHEIRDEDVARLSPLKHRSLNVLGRYSFTASQPVDGLRPLRDPDAVDLDDDDDGEEQACAGRGSHCPRPCRSPGFSLGASWLAHIATCGVLPAGSRAGRAWHRAAPCAG
ncbi:Tn3 family transposase [Streptomyces sp. ME19-01-6]|nr:Tn3 family transposase [Streptomyces sp. ME19-01-6]MDX3225446.1 Tn3 family transposase [Streptomyces sp. ME19-01-6]